MLLKNISGGTLREICAVGSAFVIGTIAVEEANAAPVQFNGNAYEFISVPGMVSWFAADTAASSSSYLSVLGHLVTITSAAENAFLTTLIGTSPTGFAGAWIGGRDPAGWLVGPEAGSAFSYTNWNSLEPNNAGYAYMSIGTFTPNSGSVGKWLDDSGLQGFPSSPADPVVGYFVEYENIAPVPLPAAGALFAGALGALGLFSRRRKKRAIASG